MRRSLLVVAAIAAALALPLAIGAQPAGSEFYVVDADGSNHRALTAGEPPEILDLSPNRKQMLLRCAPGQDREHCDGLVIADIHGGAPRTLVPLKNYNAISDSVASWSPDGTKIAFERYDTGTIGPDVWVVASDGTGLHRVARNGWLGAWSPDSQRLSFVIYEKGPSCVYGGRIQVVRTDMKGRRWVTRPGHLVCVRGLAWSPSGRYIAYLRTGKRFAAYALLVADLRLGRSRFVGYGDSPTWLPDDRLAYLGIGNGLLRRTLRISRLDGKRERVLLKNAVVGLGSRSPDGRQPALERLTDFNAGTFALEIWNQAGRRQAILDHGRINVFGGPWGFGVWWSRNARHIYCLRY
jgi:WD40 repeat protein